MNKPVEHPQPGDKKLRPDGTMITYVDAVTGWVTCYNPSAADFARLGERDRAHLRSVGNPDGHAKLEMTGRAADLSHSLKPLHKIAPVLKGNYLVKGWIDRGAASVVYGESNVGKTFFALDMALHLAAARDWHDHRVANVMGNRLAPVVYIAGEGGHGMFNRIEAMRRERADLIERAEPEGDFLLLPTMLDLCGAGDADALVQTLNDLICPPCLVVIDTLARSMGNGDENTAKDMGAFIRSVDTIRAETGAHVMIIHHSGKDVSKGARGSGSLRAAVDTEIELTRTGKIIMAETRKQRDREAGTVFAYTLKGVHIGFDEDGDEVTSAVVVPSDPVAKEPKLSGQQKIALQALDDALAKHGEVLASDLFPDNRKCASLEQWREFCDRHSLSSGEGESSRRTAFHKARNALQEKEIVRVVDGYAWRCEK